MDPFLITQLSLSAGALLLEAFDRYQQSRTLIETMVAENRGPTPEEIATLRELGVQVDAEFDALTASPE